MIRNSIKYSYNDIAVVPSTTSSISHRSEACPFDENGMLPIFTAPMTTVVDETNYNNFEGHKINSILPRSVALEVRLRQSYSGLWAAYSLKEFEEHFLHKLDLENGIAPKVLIDIANGHMTLLYEMVKACKVLNGDNIKIMIGNIANPFTYREVARCGADYVRCGIGSGFGCITTSNVAIHYPMASLISEMYGIKKQLSRDENIPMDKLPKIIADGGIRNYSDVIKALALGADYVMIGGLFASFLESASKIIDETSNSEIDIKGHESDFEIHDGKVIFNGNELKLKKVFYGMASKDGQKAINGVATKTAEGITKIVDVKYTTKGWVDNMTHYLRSAMSYTNSRTLKDFIGEQEVVVVSNNTYHSVNK